MKTLWEGMVNKGPHLANFARFRLHTSNLHTHSTISATLMGGNNPWKFLEDSWNEVSFFYMRDNLLYETKVIGVTKLLKSHVKTRSFSMGYRKLEQKKFYKTSVV